MMFFATGFGSNSSNIVFDGSMSVWSSFITCWKVFDLFMYILYFFIDDNFFSTFFILFVFSVVP